MPIVMWVVAVVVAILAAAASVHSALEAHVHGLQNRWENAGHGDT
jgi:hypothetical protein